MRAEIYSMKKKIFQNKLNNCYKLPHTVRKRALSYLPAILKLTN